MLRYRVAVVTALAVLASVAIGYARLPRSGDSAADAAQARVGELVQDKRLLLADFEVHGVDTALGRALTLATRAALEHSQLVSLISPAGVSQDLGRMQRSTGTLDLDAARELAVRAGVRAVVHGEITALAGRFVLALRLVDPESGSALVTLTTSASATVELLPAIDDLARQLRSRIGESLKHVRASPPLARVTTPSLDALQKYTAAYHAHYGERNFPKAVHLLQEAVTLDSAFAMAWRLLAVSGGSAGMGPVHRDSALSAAFRHRSRASPAERDLIVASFYQGVGRDREKAASAFEAIVRRDPHDAIATHALAIIYSTRREFVRAESLFRDVLRRDPEHVIAYGNLVLNLWHQERFVEAESLIVRGRRLFPGDDVLAMREADLFWFRNDLDRYERALDELRASNSLVLRRYGLQTRANLALMRGRLDAHRGLQAEARAGGLTFSTMPPMADSLIQARVDAEFRDQRARAVTRIDATLRAPWPEVLEPSPLQHVVAYVTAGRPDRARSVLQRQLQRMDTVSRRALQPAVERSWGWIALAEGRHAEAVTHFRRSDVRPDGADSEWTWPLALQLALTYDAAGQADSAIAAFERFLRPSISGPSLANGFHRARAYERLGVLYESKGDRQRAAHYTARLVELWKDADPELQPRVTAARQRLTQLRTPGAARN
jgi:eukaryotic-like serine/threonine-protein kinase